MKLRKQYGFTLIEHMVTVAIIALLTILAIVVYTDYTQRSRITGGLRLSSNVKQAVAEYQANHGAFPESNTQAGLAEPTEFSNTRVRSIGIDPAPSAGTIVITYKGIGGVADGDTLLLVPEHKTGSIGWKCLSRTIIGKLLPSQCR
jgi:type IV pilus assembly protein PilA